jgi:hypothetical protein
MRGSLDEHLEGAGARPVEDCTADEERGRRTDIGALRDDTVTAQLLDPLGCRIFGSGLVVVALAGHGG